MSSPRGCLSWQSWWQGCLSSGAWGHCEVAGYRGPLVLTGSGALLGELGSCLALSFPLRSPVPRGSALCLAAPSPPGSGAEAQPAAAAGCSPTAFVPVSMLLPMGSPPSCGVSGLGLAPRDWFGDNRNCLGSGCGGIQPPHPQSSPTAWLGAVADTCAPAPGGGTSPVVAQCVPMCPIVCFSVASAVSALGRSASHM